MEEQKGQTRREFLVGAGAIGAVGAVGAVVGSQVFPRKAEEIVELPFKPPEKSEGYLLVDPTKCASCQSCMLACSLVHEGKENTSLSRIQILQDAFEHFPNDLSQEQCRQCVIPPCVLSCPTNALHADAENGNVRTVDQVKCIGCQLCMNACPYVPHRTIWNHEKTDINEIGVVQKCDLCADTPYWSEEGGPDGKQACVEICPLKAITLVKEVPDQRDSMGYNINLRTENFVRLVTAGDQKLGSQVVKG